MFFSRNIPSVLVKAKGHLHKFVILQYDYDIIITWNSFHNTITHTIISINTFTITTTTFFTTIGIIIITTTTIIIAMLLTTLLLQCLYSITTTLSRPSASRCLVVVGTIIASTKPRLVMIVRMIVTEII
jgi:hypothetical protein